jgi:peroxiredoxin
MKLTDSKGKRFIRLKAGLLGLLIVVALILLFLRFQKFGPGNPDLEIDLNQYKSEQGYLAPRFTLRNLKGNLEGLDNHSEKVIIVNFWATWCVPCVKEMPSFENLYRRYRSEGLSLLAVSLDKDNPSKKVQQFVDKYSLTFPILFDTEGVAEKLYPSFTIPFTFVIDKNGRIAARIDGAKNWGSPETFKAIEYLLNQ